MKKNVVLTIVFVLLFIGSVAVYLFVHKDDNIEYEVIYVEGHEMNNDYLKDDNGKLVTIKYVNIKCMSPELELYEDGTYKLIGTVNKCVNKKCISDDDAIIKGKYDLYVPSMLGVVSAQRLDDQNKDAEWIKYTITTGKGEVFISNDKNIPLNTLLEQLNIKLDTCVRDIQQ